MNMVMVKLEPVEQLEDKVEAVVALMELVVMVDRILVAGVD